MGGCVSSVADELPPARDVPDAGPFPEEGKKLRKDARLKDVYRVGPTIGAGGFSKVKIVTDRETKEQWACKIMKLPPADAETKRERAERQDTLREIDAVLDLEHPNVVGMKEYFVEHNKVYLIMELLRGGELLDAVNTHGHYSEEDARTIFTQLMRGVQYLHSRGVVHRDLKLDNLLLAKKGDITTVKIADFGIAMKQHGHDELDQMRTVCGTTQYIAPEVIRAGRKRKADGSPPNVYGPPCDLWSCGVILFMLLSGYPPFWNESQPKLLAIITKGAFTLSDKIWKQVSKEAKDLICKLLVVDPAKRPTPEQVLAHPWLARCNKKKPLVETLQRMKSGKGLRKRTGDAGSPRLHDIIADASIRAGTAFAVDDSCDSLERLTPVPSLAPSYAPSEV